MKKKLILTGTGILLAAALVITSLYACGLLTRKTPVSADTPSPAAPAIAEPIKLSDIKIQPLTSDSAGIDVSTGFRLLCSENIGEEFLKSSLKVTPEQPFTLKKEGKGEYLMNFASPLKANSIYQFQIRNEADGKNRSWAFQTRQTFRVARTLPRNEAIQVPVDSGIEITFSNENVENLEQYFSITPSVKGRFEYHRKTAVFVPEALEYGSIYTVTLKKGLGFKGSDEKLPENYSFRFQTVAKDTGSDGSNYFSFAETSYNFTPDNAPALQVYASDDLLNATVQAEIYKYPDPDHYLADLKKYDDIPAWAVVNYQKKPYDTAGMEQVTSFPTQLAKHENSYWYSTYLVFPNQLPEGHYLAKVTLNQKEYYVPLQVSSLSVYMMLANNRTLAWVNDSATGKPVDGAVLTGDDPAKAVKTSGDGLAELEENKAAANENGNSYFRITGTTDMDFIAKVNSRNYYPYTSYSNSYQTDAYWSYLYLDKGLYLPEDTIHLWGLVKPRDDKASAGEFTLELARTDYSYLDNGNDTVIDTQQLKLSPNGTFSGSFRIAGFTPGSYMINAKIGDKLVTSTYLQVLEYSKPAYKIDVTPSKKVVFGGEKINMNLQASFFEGTPVSGLALNYSFNAGFSNGSSNEGKLTCDENGNASVNLSTATDVNAWRPQNLYFIAGNANAEEEEIRASSSILVFPRNVMLEIAGSIANDAGTIKLTASNIDLSKLKTNDSWYYSEEEYRGTPAETAVEVKLFEKYWVPRETGEYYDFINKKKVKKYEYDEQQKLVGTYPVNTDGGIAQINFTAEKDKNYYLEARYKDASGRETLETQYIYNWSFNPYNRNIYSVGPENNKDTYQTNETVVLKVRKDGSEIPVTPNGRFLYVNLKNGVISSDIRSDSTYSFPYDSRYIPNMYTKAVYFDGTYLHDAGISELSYDYTEKKLNINITPDKDSYKPGDTVKLSVDVSDRAGNPCKSEVNLSVIDEAFFAVMNQYVDTLSGVYGPNVSSGMIADYISYHSPDESGNPMAEGGEGGDSLALRKDFKDSAFFQSITTDTNGHGEASFKLPDNLTSWRVTYQGLTEDLKAGSGKITLSSKLPYFVDTLFNQIFMAGDQPSIIVRSYGSELKNTDKVDYTITVENNNGVVKSLTAQTTGNALAEVPIGKLDEGTYTVKTEGKTGSLHDGIRKSFTVVPEILTAARVDTLPLKEDIALPASKSLMTLSFLNKDSSALYNELLSLYWSWGDRLDQKLSRQIAGELLKAYYQEDNLSEESIDFSSYQTGDGGLALLTYDSSSPELSAELSALAKDSVDRYSLASYFYNLLGNKDSAADDVAYSYWGLAALDKPVLTDIHNLLDTAASILSTEEKLILGIALSYIGDQDGAETVYKEVTADRIKLEGDFVYLNVGASRDEISKATALCAILALRLDQPEKQGLFNYARSNSTTELLTNLERLIYISSYIPAVNKESSFTYELNGKKEQVVLKNDAKKTLIVTPDKLAALKFSDIKGDVTVVASYTGPVKDLAASDKSLVGLSRSYEVNGNSASDFHRSDFIKIVLTPSFQAECPDGFYQITDILPAGFRYVSSTPDGKEGWYPDEVSGQKVTFGIKYDKNTPRNKSIVYYARAVSPGSYTADSAFVKHSEMNIYGFTGTQSVTIR